MCANYIPVTRAERLLEYFGVQYNNDHPDADVFPMGLAPFIRMAPEGSSTEAGNVTRFAAEGIFRFIPDHVSRMDWARKTYNARSETVDTKKAFKEAWAKSQRCIIPAESIYEMNYETGEAVRWRIDLGTGTPMGIAGIYTSWQNPEGEVMFSMAMLTVNADDHPFMSRFHAPGDEKRMVVILDPQDFDGWLTCPAGAAKARYCRQWHGSLVGEPAPLPKRPKKVAKAPLPPPPPPEDPNLSLF